MVLGLNVKNKKGSFVQVDYLIHIQEIKPWPPSQSLRSLRNVLIQWENGDRNTGSTNTVVPSLGSVVGEGKIEFNQSFRLPVTLLREMPIRGRDSETFQKNCLEFHLYEPRRDKNMLLATSVIDLAEYGVVKETLSLSAPMNSKRSFKNTSEPVLYIKINPVEKGSTSSSLRDSLKKEALLDKNGLESVSAMMNEEYTKEAGNASFQDDDISSHTSQAASSAFQSNGELPLQSKENGLNKLKESNRVASIQHSLASKVGSVNSHMMLRNASHENLERKSYSATSVDLFSDLGSAENHHVSMASSPNSSPISILENGIGHGLHSSSSSFTYENKEDESIAILEKNNNGEFSQERDAHQSCNNSSFYSPVAVQSLHDSSEVVEEMASGTGSPEDATAPDHMNNDFVEDIDEIKQQDGHEKQNFEMSKHALQDTSLNISSEEAIRNQTSLGNDALPFTSENILKTERLKHGKSVRSLSDVARSCDGNQQSGGKHVNNSGYLHNGAGSLRSNDVKDAKIYPKLTAVSNLDSNVQHLEHKIKMLEGELREAAAIEAALYSVVAEHGSSMSKVHAPARRLSRLYLHACRESSQLRRASSARSAVSGLVLVAKACGNDVPRLTFWLSNSVALRAILSREVKDAELPSSAGSHAAKNGPGEGNKASSSPLKWKKSSPSVKDSSGFLYGSVSNWEDPQTFMSALEKVEAWIFSRAVESIWWQTLTPHMHSATTKSFDEGLGYGSRNICGRTPDSCDQEQENFSLDHWKNAFKDASERLCPVRAGGHECGCLPVLARMVMEQCIARLDVAMFNAILRESADEIPTDPVSDPISNSKVLPIQAGKTSFGSGAQLKNAVGTWSRWLTDLFGMDDEESLDNEHDVTENEEVRQDTSFKSFHLLNALSDLMMLPKDMLLSRSVRKEVCPTFGTPLIKMVLDNFVPDEFCPDPIPDDVFEAINSETLEAEDSVTNFPLSAAAPVYSSPSATSISVLIGEEGSRCKLRRSGSSVVRKSYTSDDELDELNSPLESLFINASEPLLLPVKPKREGNAIRYELLRDIWTSSE
ncbi:uncharacterized protein LOC120011024 isoform X2 [Tripterygium wilfordii]|uniref:uncharacterized protein LOC120011024 isoform X2 n=1 Tax=Tripterygium wilfordii TaxID=458696 RepID=UPI0018F84F2A|nr:uncharacterized protein LOC120011024 isoform X2 [Tripterygium wilfordii]